MKEFLFVLLLVVGPILINGEGLLPMYQTGSVKNFQSYKKTFAKIQITNALRYRSNNMDRAKYIWEEFKGKFTNEDWLVMYSVELKSQIKGFSLFCKLWAKYGMIIIYFL